MTNHINSIASTRPGAIHCFSLIQVLRPFRPTILNGEYRQHTKNTRSSGIQNVMFEFLLRSPPTHTCTPRSITIISIASVGVKQNVIFPLFDFISCARGSAKNARGGGGSGRSRANLLAIGVRVIHS